MSTCIFDLSPHWFWAGLTAVSLIWYSTVTVYVAIKGVSDIRGMLDRLSSEKDVE